MKNLFRLQWTGVIQYIIFWCALTAMVLQPICSLVRHLFIYCYLLSTCLCVRRWFEGSPTCATAHLSLYINLSSIASKNFKPHFVSNNLQIITFLFDVFITVFTEESLIKSSYLWFTDALEADNRHNK